MALYGTHDVEGTILGGFLAVAGYFYNHVSLIIIGLSCIVGSLFLSPDLHIENTVAYRRWYGSGWGWFWFPYRGLVGTRRSFFTHTPIVSDVLRLLTLIFWVVLIFLLLTPMLGGFALPNMLRESARFGGTLVLIFIGFVLATLVHWMLDSNRWWR